MQFTHNNIIPGLMTRGTEFLAVEENVLRVFHNHKEIAFEELPEYVFKAIRKEIGNTVATIGEMKAYVLGKWGGMDGRVDICEDGLPSGPEYIPDYTKAFYDCGKEISEAQLRVLKLIQYDDKSIAEKLFISPYTVARHCQDLYNNTGIKNRTQLALWAKNKGIN